MPTNLHLILFDADFDSLRLQKTIAALRSFTGRRLIQYCDQKMPAVYRQLLGTRRRRDRKNHFWQQSKHPVAIRSEPFWRTKIDYLHDNPCRNGLVYEPTAWRLSSAAHWLLDPPLISK